MDYPQTEQAAFTESTYIANIYIWVTFQCFSQSHRARSFLFQKLSYARRANCNIAISAGVNNEKIRHSKIRELIHTRDLQLSTKLSPGKAGVAIRHLTLLSLQASRC